MHITPKPELRLNNAIANALACRAASFQPSMDRARNAVGGTVTGRQWHEHKLASRIQGRQDCLQKYMSNQKHSNGAPLDPCFHGAGLDCRLCVTVSFPGESLEDWLYTLSALNIIPLIMQPKQERVWDRFADDVQNKTCLCASYAHDCWSLQTLGQELLCLSLLAALCSKPLVTFQTMQHLLQAHLQERVSHS